MRKELQNRKIVEIIAALALFHFVFLGSEYLFDGMMMYVTDSAGVVFAQSCILGISVAGFLLYPLLNRFLKNRLKRIVTVVSIMICVGSLFLIVRHESYASIMASGCVLFILLGIMGSKVHYMAAGALARSVHPAAMVGMAYACGVLLQFLNHNLIRKSGAEACVLAVALVALFVFTYLLKEKNVFSVRQSRVNSYSPVHAGIALVVMVVCMSFVFASLDNAVTLVHASGSVDIGQWPRLLLALSGLGAGFLFDIRERRYMHIMMYCITLLSTVCVAVIAFGGPFLVGLVVFYLSAGFFAVFFAVAFMELSYHTGLPELWAGLGRGVNNFCAAIIGVCDTVLFTSRGTLSVIITVILLFVLISIVVFFYSALIAGQSRTEEHDDSDKDADQKFSGFCRYYSLTEREQEVLKILLSSDENIQDIAEQLYISRAALYRHIGSLNEKTGTKSRIGLIQFYYGWNLSKLSN